MLCVTMGMFGTILFVPLFIQGVIGASATQSGTVMMPMMLTIILGSMAGGQIISRTGRYKAVALFGLSTTALGMFLLSQMGPDTVVLDRGPQHDGRRPGPRPDDAGLHDRGPELGQLRQLGVVTSVTQFARSIGGTLGAAIFGSLLANRFAPSLNDALSPSVASIIPPDSPGSVSEPSGVAQSAHVGEPSRGLAELGPRSTEAYDGLIGAIKIALASSLHGMFLDGALVVALGVRSWCSS